MTLILTNLLAAYASLIAPWLGRVLYQKAVQQIAAGDPLAKIKMYRFILIDQVITTALIAGLWLSGAIAGSRIGLGAPRSWPLTAGATMVLVGLLIWSSLRLRRKSKELREKLKRAEALLPSTLDEQRWFAAISIGAGISEELLFRGFLFYYFTLWFPHINALENTLLTSLIFGMGHLYQGWKGVLSTGLAGLILCGLFLLSGNLLLPTIVHALGDLRVLLIFGSQSEPEATAVSPA